MAGLRHGDLQAAFTFLREAEQVTGPTPFPPELLEQLRQLVPCELVNFCELDRTHRRVISDTYSTGERFEDDPEDEDVQEFWRLSHQHPVCRYHEQTGNFSAMKVSDFLTQRELRELELWVDLGRARFELEVGLPAPPWHTKVFLFHRSHRDFRERDREILNLLQPHLAHLYESAKKRRLAEALAAGAEADGELVVLDAGDTIEFATAPARRMLRDYCPEQRGARIPMLLAEWLWEQRRRWNGDSVPSPGRGLTIENGGPRRLVVTPLNGDDRALLLTEEAVPATDARPLSFREWQVLALVEEGKSNAEIAAQLWIAPGTARTHLENIYAKLGVHSRMAAVARARTLKRAKTG